MSIKLSRKHPRERSIWEDYQWNIEEAPDHTHDEPCPNCRSQMKEDPIGGFFLKCPRCGLETW